VSHGDRIIIHICCDASWKRRRGSSQGRGGIAVILTIYTYTPKCSTSELKRVCFLENADDNHECELIAILESLCLAIEQIRKHTATLTSPADIDVILWSDSHAALNRLNKRGQSGNRFYSKTSNIYDLIVQKTHQIEAMGRSAEVRFRWVKGESVHDHSLADYWSKRAVDREEGSESLALAAIRDLATRTTVPVAGHTKEMSASSRAADRSASCVPVTFPATKSTALISYRRSTAKPLASRYRVSTLSSGQPPTVSNEKTGDIPRRAKTVEYSNIVALRSTLASFPARQVNVGEKIKTRPAQIPPKSFRYAPKMRQPAPKPRDGMPELSWSFEIGQLVVYILSSGNCIDSMEGE
jgi:ribonuclease HI